MSRGRKGELFGGESRGQVRLPPIPAKPSSPGSGRPIKGRPYKKAESPPVLQGAAILAITGEVGEARCATAPTRGDVVMVAIPRGEASPKATRPITGVTTATMDVGRLSSVERSQTAKLKVATTSLGQVDDIVEVLQTGATVGVGRGDGRTEISFGQTPPTVSQAANLGSKDQPVHKAILVRRVGEGRRRKARVACRRLSRTGVAVSKATSRT